MEPIKIIELQWHGPFKFNELLSENDNEEQFSKPGVYLWVERKHNRLCYVGRSLSNILKRQKDHNTKLVGGLYTIPKEYRRSETRDWIPNQNENADILFDQDKFVDLITDAFSYRDDIDIYLCPVTESKEMLKALERNLLFDLQPYGTKPGRFSPPNPKIEIVHKNAGWKETVDKAYRCNITLSE